MSSITTIVTLLMAILLCYTFLLNICTAIAFAGIAAIMIVLLMTLSTNGSGQMEAA